MGRARILIVGGGFAGYHGARRLQRLTAGGRRAEVTVVSSTDYFLYLPLLPQVAAGVLEPPRIAVSLPGTLPGVRFVQGEVHAIDLEACEVHFLDPEGRSGCLGYDRLLITVGSVNKLAPVPGLAEHAHGFRGLPEALYLRDHVIRQVELAEATDDAKERAARLTFVVGGAGYTGTEVAAQCSILVDGLVAARPRLAGTRPRWLLVDRASRILPELAERLSTAAAAALTRRGVEIRTGVSVAEANATGVRLSDGTTVATRTLAWCVGFRPDPLVESLGLPTVDGRLRVDGFLQVPGHPQVYACGDAVAVPNAAAHDRIAPMSAQHAVRQARLAARNIAVSFGHGHPRTYRHRDLGFLVDLGGLDAAANPLHVPLSGPGAAALTRAYHLLALPGGRAHTALDWSLAGVAARPPAQFGLVRGDAIPLDTATPELPAPRSSTPPATASAKPPSPSPGTSPPPAGARRESIGDDMTHHDPDPRQPAREDSEPLHAADRVVRDQHGHPIPGTGSDPGDPDAGGGSAQSRGVEDEDVGPAVPGRPGTSVER